MRPIPLRLIALLLLLSAGTYAQLGFCTGSKGEPIFTENFGNGTTYGPALQAGLTTYAFIPGAPQDGQYTLFYHSNQYSTWHYSLDHTPDVTNGPNGKMLLMNANAVTSGDFYKKTVSGLCVNTTFEFSAWLMNVYNPNTNYCGAGQIPINVRFEIWNADETLLLGSGNTGNIMGSPAPTWQQFALVFTNVNETSVVLKMKNNGLGGCGNDLAIDDISFSSCGDLTTVSSPLATGTTYTSCSSASLQLNAATSGGNAYFYQWQTSSDAITWTDIAGATTSAYTTPNLSALTYYRVKAAQDIANLGNNFCSTLSNVFTVAILPAPNPAVSNGNVTICSDQPIPALSVFAGAGIGINWYDAPSGGNLLQADSPTYTPVGSGTYYAEAYHLTSNCLSSPRTPVSLNIIALPDATISGATTVCGGSSATISFSGTPNAVVRYTIDNGTEQLITLNTSGSAIVTTSPLTATTTYTLVSVASPILNLCSSTINESVVVTVTDTLSASISGPSTVCSGTAATLNFTGTANATVAYTVNNGATQTVNLDSFGNASVVQSNITSTQLYSLQNASFAGCSQNLTQAFSLTVVGLPTASISASPLSVCPNQTSTISFSGTPNAIVTYSIAGGAPQIITLDGMGSAGFVSNSLTSQTLFSLLSVELGNAPFCNVTLNGSATVSVGSAPTASITASATVCNGSAATFSFSGTPLASIAYTQNAGPVQNLTLDAAGQASVVVQNVTATQTFSLVSVTSPGALGCTQPLSQSVSVTAIAPLGASVVANPLQICANQPTTLNFTGTPNAIVTYAANSGMSQTVALNASGAASVVVTVGSNTTFELLSVSLSGCSLAINGSTFVTINAVPDVLFTGQLQYCEGQPVVLNLTSTLPGTTFNWTVSQNGTTGGTPGTGNLISQNIGLSAANAGTITYLVTPMLNGCSGNPISIPVTIQPLPIPLLQGGVICTSDSAPVANQFYILNTQLDPATHSFQWSYGGNVLPGAIGSTYQATQTGTYTVIATSSTGCISDPVDAIVGEMSQGESLLIQQSEAFSDNPTITITVLGGDGPFLFQLDGGNFQQSNVFQNVASGTHTITVTDGACTDLSAVVTVVTYPKFFTPNGDGFNDTWNIEGVTGIINIFDRYGKLITQIGSQTSGWDGSYNGSQLPATDYWFVIEYTDGFITKNFSSHFSLKR